MLLTEFKGRCCTINVNESRGWKETNYPLFESKRKQKTKSEKNYYKKRGGQREMRDKNIIE